MTITNIINDENMTIVQGVNGISLLEESWVMEKIRGTYKALTSTPEGICAAGENIDLK